MTPPFHSCVPRWMLLLGDGLHIASQSDSNKHQQWSSQKWPKVATLCDWGIHIILCVISSKFTALPAKIETSGPISSTMRSLFHIDVVTRESGSCLNLHAENEEMKFQKPSVLQSTVRASSSMCCLCSRRLQWRMICFAVCGFHPQSQAWDAATPWRCREYAPP